MVPARPGPCAEGVLAAVAITVSELGTWRRILVLLVRRDLRLRYAGAWLGYVWTILDPLMMALVYAFVFQVLIGGRTIGEEPYILYLLVGMLGWNWFNTSVTEACRSLTAEAKIVRSANVPREIWVARTVLSKGTEFILALPVVLGFCLYYQHGVNAKLLLFPVGLVLEFMLAFGIGLVLAPLTVLANDVQRVIKIFLRVGFYLSPVLYSLNHVAHGREWVIRAAELNPLAGVLSLYRMGFWSEDTLSWRAYTVSTVAAVAVLAIGLAVFRRFEGTVLKEI
jgi:ABC-2 type transport system permease protein